MNWSKELIDFGEIKAGSNGEQEIMYLGIEDVNTLSFTVSCGCTSPVFNREKRTLKVSLNVSQKGSKQSTITVTSPRGQDFITLKAIGI
jgi:hypothetical protein